MTACESRVYWWDGEYEGECELPAPHLPLPHWDGLSWWDDDGNDLTTAREAYGRED